jgi:hypothetical protein
VSYSDGDEDDGFVDFDSHEEDEHEGEYPDESREQPNITPLEVLASEPVSIPSAPRKRVIDVQPTRAVSNGAPKKIRVRPMPQNLRTSWPDVQTMLITNMSGSQILFIR